MSAEIIRKVKPGEEICNHCRFNQGTEFTNGLLPVVCEIGFKYQPKSITAILSAMKNKTEVCHYLQELVIKPLPRLLVSSFKLH
jgi:hypothetical protein